MDDEDVYGTFVGKEPLLPASRPDALSGCDRRWLMVGILSVLSCLNEAICFSYAPIANIAETRWAQQAHSSNLIAVYFITYIPCSFLGSWFMDRRGLRQGVLLGGFLQAVGSSLRYVACFMSPRAEAHVTFLGQIIASTAMPFMVNSPPVLSANWFPPSMRASPTSVMVNANAMGVALVYLIAETVFNVISAQLGKMLTAEEFSKEHIGIIGALFIISSLVGSQIISRIVDKMQSHKQALQLCLLLTTTFILLFKVALDDHNEALTLAMLMLAGGFLGPLLPIAVELGVECAFPTSEATVAALQQLAGNFFSAIVVSGVGVAWRHHIDASGHVPANRFYASPQWIMAFLLGLTFVVFCFLYDLRAWVALNGCVS
ncbi:TPA: hypothetical protein N0F65_003416 [Lagenidium giganteum]|uniref:Major facilitator superfamily associated domain-containing protein n=1 Tax=Lagenidium giganteum TaxID=4803 RepID=A0AAV2YME0_9STRA|nr:TPA: hypothetical protein N0F65_003416 [Lagenidium giganteum]